MCCTKMEPFVQHSSNNLASKEIAVKDNAGRYDINEAVERGHVATDQ